MVLAGGGPENGMWKFLKIQIFAKMDLMGQCVRDVKGQKRHVLPTLLRIVILISIITVVVRVVVVRVVRRHGTRSKFTWWRWK